MPADGPDEGSTIPSSGAHLLDQVLEFALRFIAFPSSDAAIATVLWIAHAHLMDAWETTPRLGFISPEPASGKTRALEVIELLVPRPLLAVNVSSAALFRLIGREEGLPTVLHDELDTIFGAKAKEHEDLRGLLNAGYRRGAKTYRAQVHGKGVGIEEIEAYSAVAYAGLGGLPETLFSRTIVVRMRPRTNTEKVEPFRRRRLELAGAILREEIASWAMKVEELVRDPDPDMPAGIDDRNADLWEPLLAIADTAGGDWPVKARVAAVALVAGTGREEVSLGVRLLADIRRIFEDREVMATKAILEGLVALEEAPWGDLRGKPLDPRGLARMLGKYDIQSSTVRVGGDTPKGYKRVDLHDAWVRYLVPVPKSAATSATDARADDWHPVDWGADP